jgi:sugar (glycoside-pentoside-hexuronide) transporter
MKKERKHYMKDLKNSTWRVVLWSLLDSGNNAPFIFMLTYFLVYNTESFGIAPALVGIMMSASRVFDAFTDPVIGLFIDKLDTKWGKFRPSLILGAIILNITLVLMYWGPDFSSEITKIIYMAVLYVGHIIGYTFVTATWKSGNTVITNDPKQRSKQGMYMTIGTMVIGIFILAGAPVLLPMFGGYNSAVAWRIFAVIVSSINIVSTLLAVVAISNRDSNEFYIVSDNQPSFKEFTPILKENKPLRMLIVAASTNKLASTTMTAVMFYWFAIVMRDNSIQSTMSMISLPVSIIAAITATIIAVKTSKRFTMIVGSWASIAIIILMLIIRPFGPDKLGIYLIMGAAMAAFNAIANAQINVMIADTADYELWKTGKAIPGMISTTFSFIDKLTSAASTALVGGVIGLYGYQTGMDASPALFWSIVALYLGVPLFGHIASIWGMNRYELDREMNMKIAEDLQALRVK